MIYSFIMELLLFTLLSACSTISAASPTAPSSPPPQQDAASVQQLIAQLDAREEDRRGNADDQLELNIDLNNKEKIDKIAQEQRLQQELLQKIITLAIQSDSYKKVSPGKSPILYSIREGRVIADTGELIAKVEKNRAHAPRPDALCGALIIKGRSGKICRIEPFFYSQGKISNEGLMIQVISYFVWDAATEEPCVSDVVVVIP